MSLNAFDFIINNQEEFQKELGFDVRNMTLPETAAYMKEQTYLATEELHEMMREVPYVKTWKDYSHLSEKDILNQRENAVEEFIDVIHFVGNLALALGLNGSDIEKAYARKHSINYQRQTDPKLGYVHEKED